MFLKKKKGGAAGLVGPAPINLRSELPFQRHFAQALNTSLMSRLDSKTNPLPTVNADKITRVEQLKAFHSYWVSKDYAESRGARLMTGESEAGEVTLPLPKHYVSNEELMLDGVQPRKFYNVGSFMEDDRFKLVRQEGSYPRCGLTGNFYRREELVDNMHNATTIFNFQEPFWVKSDHPEIKNGYLKLHEDADPLIFSLTGAVLSIGTDISLEQLPYSKYLAPQFRAGEEAESVDKASTAGVNAYTGQKSVNPWVIQNTPNGWITLEQLQPFSPGPLKPMQHNANTVAGNSGSKKDAETRSANELLQFADKGTVVELEQWEMYHCSHLVQPGKLSYDRKVAAHIDERRSAAVKGEDSESTPVAPATNADGSRKLFA